MKARLAASLGVALLVVACSGSQPKPLPGGLPPEFEPGRPFPSAAPAAPPPAPAAAPAPPSAAPSATPKP